MNYIIAYLLLALAIVPNGKDCLTEYKCSFWLRVVMGAGGILLLMK